MSALGVEFECVQEAFMNRIEYTGRANLEVMQEAKNYNRFLVELVLAQIRDSEFTVDFGAGSGTFSVPVAAVNRRLVCVETDPVLCAKLSEQGLKVVSSLDLLEDDSVDYLYTLNVLEHIEDDDATVTSWMQKLRPGGKLLVYVPAFDVLFSSMDRKVGHHRRYTKRVLMAKLKRAGFEVLDAKYADSLGYIATLIFKVIGNGEGTVNLGLLKAYDRFVFPLSRLLDFFVSSLFGKNVYALAVKATK